jgi:RHS repeat-associated protein
VNDSVTRNGVAYASYVYNAMEQLASRNTSAPGGPIGTVHYIYDTQGHLIAEADAATGATTREYLWLPSNDNRNDTMAEDMMAANDNAPVDLPLAVVNVSATPVIYQVHTDHLGRPIRMTDAAKATIWQATWKPWGEVQSITGAVAQNLRFPGQYFQLETGLAYNWHRTYDPVTGRYTQPDPLRFVDGPSVYQYAMASPFMRTDRDGQEVIGGNGKRDWKLPQCIGCIEWPPKNGGASGDGGTGANEGGSSGGWLNWLFPPSNDNIPKRKCLFAGEKERTEGQYNTPGQCSIVKQVYCTYKCHSGGTKSYPKLTMHIPCNSFLLDNPPYDD